MIVRVVDRMNGQVICKGELIDENTRFGNFRKMAEEKGLVFDDDLATIDGKYFFKIKGCEKYDALDCELGDTEHISFYLSPDSNCRVTSLDDITDAKQPFDFISLSTLGMVFDRPIEIIDLKTGEIIAKGPVQSEKDRHNTSIVANESLTVFQDPNTNVEHQCHLVSTDSKHFFWANGNEKYSVRFIDDDSYVPVEYVERPDYIQVLWKEGWEKIETADVIRDFSIDECDPEIQELVYALNRIPDIITVVSCCGHGVYPGWVTMNVCSMEGLMKVLGLLSDCDQPYCGKFVIDPGHISVKTHGGVVKPPFYITISTIYRGDKAYEAFDQLTKRINELYGGEHAVQ